MSPKTRRKRTRNILTLAISCAILTWYLIGVGLDNYLPSLSIETSFVNNTPDNSSTGLTVRRFDKTGQLQYTLRARQADYFIANANTDNIASHASALQPWETARPHDDLIDIHIIDSHNDQMLMEDFDNTIDNIMDSAVEDNTGSDNSSANQRYSYNKDFLRLMQPRIAAYNQGVKSTLLNAKLAYLVDNGDTAELIGDVQVHDLDAFTQLNTRTLTLNMALQQILTQHPVTIQTETTMTHATGLQGNLTDQRWQLLSEVRSVIQP